MVYNLHKFFEKKLFLHLTFKGVSLKILLQNKPRNICTKLHVSSPLLSIIRFFQLTIAVMHILKQSVQKCLSFFPYLQKKNKLHSDTEIALDNISSDSAENENDTGLERSDCLERNENLLDLQRFNYQKSFVTSNAPTSEEFYIAT